MNGMRGRERRAQAACHGGWGKLRTISDPFSLGTWKAQYNKHVHMSCVLMPKKQPEKHSGTQTATTPTLPFFIFAFVAQERCEVRAAQFPLLLCFSCIPLLCIRAPLTHTHRLPHTHPATHVISLDMPLKVAQWFQLCSSPLFLPLGCSHFLSHPWGHCL